MGLASARGREKDHAKVTSAFARCRDQRRCEYKRRNPAGNTGRVGDKNSSIKIYSSGLDPGSGPGSGPDFFSLANFSR